MKEAIRSNIRLAKKNDTPVIVGFLKDMQIELQEFELEENVCHQSIVRSMDENIYWFLFINEKGESFGVCQMQSIHRYWSLQRRFYMGGFYIRPEYRGKGRFKEIYSLLKEWAKDQDGVQIYSHIHKDNYKSLRSFYGAGMKDVGYTLMVDHWGDD